MSNVPIIEVKVRLVLMNVHYKDTRGGLIGTLDFSANSMTPTPPQEPPQPEIDPRYVMLGFNLEGDMGINDQSGSLLLKTEEAKRLNLMVGDLVTIRLTKQ